MYFDTTIQVYTMDVIGVPDQHHVILQFQSGIIVPGPPPKNPGEPQQQGLIPIGVYKIPTGYQLACEFRDELVEVLEKIEPPPKPSGLIVARGQGAKEGVEALAKQQAEAEKALKGNS